MKKWEVVVWWNSDSVVAAALEYELLFLYLCVWLVALDVSSLRLKRF
jgi:hypothetical protein